MLAVSVEAVRQSPNTELHDLHCRLPDGSFWPEVQEGMHQVDHGVVICKLCQRHHKANNFAGEGYRFAGVIASACCQHAVHCRRHLFCTIVHCDSIGVQISSVSSIFGIKAMPSIVCMALSYCSRNNAAKAVNSSWHCSADVKKLFKY